MELRFLHGNFTYGKFKLQYYNPLEIAGEKGEWLGRGALQRKILTFLLGFDTMKLLLGKRRNFETKGREKYAPVRYSRL